MRLGRARVHRPAGVHSPDDNWKSTLGQVRRSLAMFRPSRPVLPSLPRGARQPMHSLRAGRAYTAACGGASTHLEQHQSVAYRVPLPSERPMMIGWLILLGVARPPTAAPPCPPAGEGVAFAAADCRPIPRSVLPDVLPAQWKPAKCGFTSDSNVDSPGATRYSRCVGSCVPVRAMGYPGAAGVARNALGARRCGAHSPH